MLSNIFVSKDFISLEEESEDGGLKGLLRRFAELGSTPNLADFYPILSGLDLQGITKKSKEMFGQIIGVFRVITKQRREDKGNDVSRQRDFLDSLLDSELHDDQINYLIQSLIKFHYRIKDMAAP
ncbi:hypothetical protein IFM89_032856 [Coptis chinensis]|uniref:Uncharacterized protein n=1 Tax=Coptis chinensis TaxID=261450 RepID=A0A835IH32_9MAGN|nr:hypothetical protein IFM89_032856 [Coptis chinensis]